MFDSWIYSFYLVVDFDKVLCILWPNFNVTLDFELNSLQ